MRQSRGIEAHLQWSVNMIIYIIIQSIKCGSIHDRIGLIGCGFYAQNHLNAWADLNVKEAELVAVCDIGSEKAEAAGKKFGAPFYTDVDQMPDIGGIDLLDIVTQMDRHGVLSAKAAKRKIATILQTPLAPGIDEAIAIVENAERQGVWLAVHENFRFGTGMRRIKAVIESDAIGEPNWARISFRTGYDVYRGQPCLAQVDRLAILDTGIHVLDLARFFLGEVERISCETQQRNPSAKAEDSATMMLRHVSGAVSIVETTYESRCMPVRFPKHW